MSTASYNPYFNGAATAPTPQGWRKLPKRREFDQASGYICQPGLIDAVNVALALGQPLLLTGEPGTGKSTLAKNIAFELGCDDLELKVEIKSSTTAKDLFYTFDHIGWFNSKSIDGVTPDARDYIRLTGLGKALLFACQQVPTALVGEGFKRGEQRRSVVLIDEVDKAPRDVPNDLLNEIEHMYFKVPEINNVEVKADAAFRPIVIITSNSEKVLPDAFLRRCVFYNIEFPDEETLRRILVSRFSQHLNNDSQLLKDAISLLNILRQSRELDKKPGLSELIEFVEVVRHHTTAETGLRSLPELVKAKLSCLVKCRLDPVRTDMLLAQWQKA